MIEPFEAALADLLADRTAGAGQVGAVLRWRDGLPAPAADAAQVTVQVLDAALTDEVGADRNEELRRTADITLRNSLRLAGRVRIGVLVGTAGLPGDQLGQRALLMGAADAILVALHDPAVRNGRVWGEEQEQGFAIDRFRLDRMEQLEQPPGQFRRMDIWCNYAGRFWPVEPAVEGPVISEPPVVRIATLDAVLPAGLRAVGGGADVRAPITVALDLLGGATPRLVARLAGSAPPGQLIGDTAQVPPGSVGYLPSPEGRFDVVFRPAAVLAGSAVARVVLSLAGDGRPTVRLGEFSIEVAAS